MKFEQNEQPLLFSETVIPDIFFAEYLSQIPGDYIKIYLYLIFLAKFKKNINLNDLSKKLSLPLKSINDGIQYLESNNLILKKENNYTIVNIQETTLHKLYTLNLVSKLYWFIFVAIELHFVL